MKELYTKLKTQLSNTNTGEMSDRSFDSIKNICEIANPKSILEIGFNRGNSALMWLLNSNANLTSIDIRTKEEIKTTLEVLNKEFGERFEYHKVDAYNELPFKSEWVGKFDLIFIDCWHVPLGYELDTNTAMYFGSQYIAYDDYVSHPHSSFIQNYIKDNDSLKELKTYPTGNGQSLIKNENSTQTKGNEEILLKIKNLLKENSLKLEILKKRFNLK